MVIFTGLSIYLSVNIVEFDYLHIPITFHGGVADLKRRRKPRRVVDRVVSQKAEKNRSRRIGSESYYEHRSPMEIRDGATDLLHEARGGAPSGSPEIVAGSEGLRRRQGSEGGGGPSSGGGGQGHDSVEQSDFKNSTQIEPEASQT